MDVAIHAQYLRAYHFAFNHAFLTWDGMNAQGKQADENPSLEHAKHYSNPVCKAKI
jgi:hypothetical protein